MSNVLVTVRTRIDEEKYEELADLAFLRERSVASELRVAIDKHLASAELTEVVFSPDASGKDGRK